MDVSELWVEVFFFFCLVVAELVSDSDRPNNELMEEQEERMETEEGLQVPNRHKETDYCFMTPDSLHKPGLKKRWIFSDIPIFLSLELYQFCHTLV